MITEKPDASYAKVALQEIEAPEEKAFPTHNPSRKRQVFG